MADTTQASHPTSFDDIPDEQLERILSDTITRPDEGLRLALTCKRWYRVGIPLVFRSVLVHPNNIEAFITRVQSSLPSKDSNEGQQAQPGLGTYVKEVLCIAGPPSGAILGPGDLTRLFEACPNIEDLFLARFWHQWFHDALSRFPTLAKVKKFTWLHDYSPLPNPPPDKWIGQFRTWPALENLNLRMLSFMDGASGFSLLGATDNDANQSTLSAIIPDPQCKLREFALVGNIVPSRSLVAGLSALRAPLEVLEIHGVALLGPAGIVQALQLVGGKLRELRVIDDGRIGAIGNIATVLLPRIKELCPLLRRLELRDVSFPRNCFDYLPEGLKKLVVSKPGPLGALELLEVLLEARGGLKELEELQWAPEAVEEGWQKEDIQCLVDWGKNESIRISISENKEVE